MARFYYTDESGYGYASRPRIRRILERTPCGGGTIVGNTVSVFIKPGKSSSDTLTEEISAGCTAENIVVDNGEFTVSGNTISWTLSTASAFMLPLRVELAGDLRYRGARGA
ncbi:MAG: hypothetical protein ACP5I1_01590 [Candidatus Hinthialibacter sp.]